MSHQYSHHMPPEPPLHYRIARRAPEPRNGLGVVALVLSSAGLAFGVVPLMFLSALSLAVVAAVLVTAGWVRIGRGRATNRVVTAIGSVTTAGALAVGLWGGSVFFGSPELGSGLDAFGGSRQPTSAPAKPSTDEPADEPPDEPSGRPTGEPITYEMGDTVHVADRADTAASIKVGGPRVRAVPVDELGSAPANGRFVIFAVKVACDSGRLDIAAEDFYVRTRSGDRYDVEDGNAWAATVKEQFSAEEVGAGERERGPMAFDLPVAHGELVYSPNLEGKPVAIWTF